MLRKISVMVCGLTALIMLAACSGVESKENTGAAGVSTENTEEAQTSAPTETPVATPTETSTETPAPAPHDHSYTSAVTKEATCEADGQGEITYTCSICGDTYTEETDTITIISLSTFSPRIKKDLRFLSSPSLQAYIFTN